MLKLSRRPNPADTANTNIHVRSDDRTQPRPGAASDLLTALEAEVETVAVMSGFIASVLNRALAHSAITGLEKLLSQMPNQPILLSTAARTEHADQIRTVADRAGLLAIALADAKRAMHRFFGRRDPAQTMGELAHVTGLWRKVCRNARLTYAAIAASPLRVEAPTARVNTARLTELLVNCEAGGWRSISHGDPEIPDWAQRRRHRRVLLNMRALAHYGHITRDVLIRDASPGGFGIDFADNVAIGERMQLTLSDDRKLAGRVVWARGQRAGVQLFEELPPDDSLFAWRW